MTCGSINKPRMKVRPLKFALNPLNCELLTFAAHALANIYPIMGSTMLQTATHVVQKKYKKSTKMFSSAGLQRGQSGYRSCRGGVIMIYPCHVGCTHDIGYL